MPRNTPKNISRIGWFQALYVGGRGLATIDPLLTVSLAVERERNTFIAYIAEASITIYSGLVHNLGRKLTPRGGGLGKATGSKTSTEEIKKKATVSLSYSQ